MDTFITIVVLAGLVWAAFFAYQLILGKQLNEPVQRTVAAHPTIAIQQLVSAAADRGWGTELRGTTVVAKHGSGASVLVDVAPSGQGSAMTASISGVRTGSLAAVKTHKGGQALLRKRTAIMAAV
ncbi:hypothetical protein [Gordonia sp. N1V]|uniref:hypothetical protein n=1 Tax=Gordonia sp. N1V TaxID=3034163 RepID=UPI0023E2332D|nr:hypothetical protein [Gordonia sp. N1V]MDF3284665.1 hypothetical protein [Gordonia sp. N1V]